MNRRREDRKWNLLPSWVDGVMIVLKFLIVITPLLCISIAMWIEGTTVGYSYLHSAVWGLALLRLIDYAGE